MTNYFFTRLSWNIRGQLQLYLKFTSDYDVSRIYDPSGHSIHDCVQELADAVNALDTKNVTVLVLDIDHCFDYLHEDESERIASLNVLDEFFVAVGTMRLTNLNALELRIDDRVGLTSIDACRLSQKIATFRNEQHPPFPSVSIVGRSHSVFIHFLKIDVSQLTTLTHLSLNFVEVDGLQLWNLVMQARDLEFLRLQNIVMSGFNAENDSSPLLSFCDWLSNDESLFVCTKLNFQNQQELVQHGVHNFQFDSDWVRNKHLIGRAHKRLLKETGKTRLVNMVNILSKCNAAFNAENNKVRAAYSLLREHYVLELVNAFLVHSLVLPKMVHDSRCATVSKALEINPAFEKRPTKKMRNE